MLSRVLLSTLLAASIALLDAPVALAQEPADRRAQLAEVDESATEAEEALDWPGEPVGPVYETWWFWTGIGAVVLGVTLALVVGLTTSDPVSGRRAGLELRF